MHFFFCYNKFRNPKKTDIENRIKKHAPVESVSNWTNVDNDVNGGGHRVLGFQAF